METSVVKYYSLEFYSYLFQIPITEIEKLKEMIRLHKKRVNMLKKDFYKLKQENAIKKLQKLIKKMPNKKRGKKFTRAKK